MTISNNAVHEFVNVANKHLVENRGIAIEREFQFCGGAPMQYKCAVAFADVSHDEDFNFLITRSFYGFEHGKGESDGETGVLKTKLDDTAKS